MFQEFPKMKYHPQGRTAVVHSAEHEAALGEEWESRPFPEEPTAQTEAYAPQPTTCPDCQGMKDTFDKAWAKQEEELIAANSVIEDLRKDSEKKDRAIAALGKKLAAAEKKVAKDAPKSDTPQPDGE